MYKIIKKTTEQKFHT